MTQSGANTEVKSWFGGAERVLFVHAHPDDETITTGGTLAALAAAGRKPALITLTRGERGETTPGPHANLRGAQLAGHRKTELARALCALGVQRHSYLGLPPARAAGMAPVRYVDSGMCWLPDGRAGAALDAPANSLTRAEAASTLNDLLAGCLAFGATAIVSYDAGGGYGHPDHVRAQQLARAVAVALEVPFWEIVPADGPEFDPAVDSYDVSKWVEAKTRALMAHASQLRVEGANLRHVGGQTQEITLVERFRLRK